MNEKEFALRISNLMTDHGFTPPSLGENLSTAMPKVLEFIEWLCAREKLLDR